MLIDRNIHMGCIFFLARKYSMDCKICLARSLPLGFLHFLANGLMLIIRTSQMGFREEMAIAFNHWVKISIWLEHLWWVS